MMSFPFTHPLLALGLAGICATSHAQTFAPVDAKATLSVEYTYESVGKQQDPNDLREWNTKRSVSMLANLASQAPTPLPTMQALDAAQTGKLDAQAAQMQKMATTMAPMTANIESIMTKCGEDESCMEREAMAMGSAMAGTPEADAMLNAGKETAKAVQPGAPRYQAWRATTQSGSYVIDETAHSEIADPICQPTLACTRDVVRKGSGAVPSQTATSQDVGLFYAAEVDTENNTLTVTLPVPLLPLPYTETITTDEPDGSHDTPTPKGPQSRQLVFHTTDDGNHKPFTVPLKGDWHNQSGERVVKLNGTLGDGGNLTVRWHFEVQ